MSLWVSRPATSVDASWSSDPTATTGMNPLAPVPVSGAFGRALVVQSALGRAEIRTIRLTVNCGECFPDFSVDDITYSPVAQPDTEILARPDAVTRSPDASFVFLGNQPDTRFDCSLDGSVAVACRPPFTAYGLPAGPHTFTVGDARPVRDARPDARRRGAGRSTSRRCRRAGAAAPDADADGVPDAQDNCPARVQRGQADGDEDGVGDACETAPSGALPPVAGVRVTAEVLSGDVYIKLPVVLAAVVQAARRSPASCR